MIAIQVFVVNVPVHSTICMLESVVAESFLVNEAAVLPETYSMNDWSSKQRQAGITHGTTIGLSVPNSLDRY